MEGMFTEAQKEKLRDPYTIYGKELQEVDAELVIRESRKPEGEKTKEAHGIE